MRANLILGLIGSVFTLVLLFELLRRKHLREKYAVLWVAVSLLTLAVAAFPQTIYFLSDLIGVEVPVNLLFFVASMLLLGISVHHSYELGRLEDRTRALAEEVALLRLGLEHPETNREATLQADDWSVSDHQDR
ncbi:DUF2304 domain-containing protein [Nocardioides iriomotensis]|nr:DUF2304 domain-containing protein [Nocardioides iriomotensis]